MALAEERSKRIVSAMRSSALIAACLIAGFLFSGFQSDNNKNATRPDNAETQQQGQDRKVAVVAVPEVSVDQRKDKFDWMTLSCTVLLTIVGIVGTCIALQTLRAIQVEVRTAVAALQHSSRLARAAQNTAEAANKNAEFSRLNAEATNKSVEAAVLNAQAAALTAQAIVNSERPWLFVGTSEPVMDPRKTQVQFKVTNRGRTPAEVLIYTGEFMFSTLDSLSVSPKYGLEGQQFSHTKYLVPGDSFEVYSFDCGILIEEEHWAQMNRKQPPEYIVFFGHVVYRDLMTREQHETRYCYWLSPHPSIGLIKGGHPGGEWNKHT